MEEVAWCTFPGEGFGKLMRGPIASRMGSYVEMNHPSSLMSQHDENEQQSKRHRGHHEEIGRNQLGDMVVEKGAPRLRGRLARPNHTLGDGRLRYIDSQFEQLPVDSRCAPEWIDQTD